jgi:hypothetical protein
MALAVRKPARLANVVHVLSEHLPDLIEVQRLISTQTVQECAHSQPDGGVLGEPMAQLSGRLR